MNLKTRLSINFMVQVFLLFGIVCVIALGFLGYLFVENYGGASGENPAFIIRHMPAETHIVNGHVTLSTAIVDGVANVHGWVQVLNSDGDEVYSYHRPSAIPTAYAPGQLVEYRTFPQRYGYQLYTWYDRVQGSDLTWLLGVPYHSRTLYSVILPGLLAVLLFLAAALATFVVALVFGRRMGAPLLHMMTWLQALSEGRYEEPMDWRGRPRSHGWSGRLKSSYRLYREVIEALTNLSQTMQSARVERGRLESAREEWITGVSHDLKTPLSSVRGYGDLMAASQYDWTPEEVRQFGRIIVEKALYMEGLIDDLSLTFRLKNEALPLKRVPMSVTAVLRSAVIDVVNRPEVNDGKVEFECDEDMMYPLDQKWFRRAIDNLLLNAVNHNPPQTRIVLSAHAEVTPDFHYPGILISIVDNGRGMDEATLRHLFDRYYRGTNTSDIRAQGSGLGAAIAKQLIEAHGGTVTVNSRVGEGTTCLISLPPQNSLTARNGLPPQSGLSARNSLPPQN